MVNDFNMTNHFPFFPSLISRSRVKWSFFYLQYLNEVMAPLLYVR